jgi:hypothetical protein
MRRRIKGRISCCFSLLHPTTYNPKTKQHISPHYPSLSQTYSIMQFNIVSTIALCAAIVSAGHTTLPATTNTITIAATTNTITIAATTNTMTVPAAVPTSVNAEPTYFKRFTNAANNGYEATKTQVVRGGRYVRDHKAKSAGILAGAVGVGAVAYGAGTHKGRAQAGEVGEFAGKHVAPAKQAIQSTYNGFKGQVSGRWSRVKGPKDVTNDQAADPTETTA